MLEHQDRMLQAMAVSNDDGETCLTHLSMEALYTHFFQCELVRAQGQNSKVKAA